MPELPEVEAYRSLVEERALGRVVERVDAPDAWYLKRATTARAARASLTGRRFVGARRRGKLLLVDTDRDGPTLGLRFGMTGRLVVDGRDVHDWDRFVVRFDDGGDLRMRDPRRLGGVELDPDERRLGPDALTLQPAELARVLGDSRAPLKARLMDQSRLAGLGNLLVDETLWRAGLDPARPAGSLTAAERRRLHRHVTATLADLIDRGGSHTGELHLERRPGGLCPRDGTPLVRRTVCGRTTFSCPLHQG